MFRPTTTTTSVPAQDPPRVPLWTGLILVVLVGACLQGYRIGSWPLADDEVPSLVEMGLLHIDAPAYFSVPPDQLARLPKATIVWNTVQRLAISVMPAGELGYRLPSLICALLFSALTFYVAARWRGLWFASALAVLVNGSQPFVYLAQVNRFYAMPLLLTGLALLLMWVPRRDSPGPAAAVGVLTVLTVLSHNVTLPVFGLAFGAAVAGYVLGIVPRRVVVRSGVALAIGAAVYLFYLRPLIAGWNSTGNPTPVLVSYAAHVGVPALALAALGAWLVLGRLRDDPVLAWWTAILLATPVVLQLAPITWNPRYFLFYFPAVWMLGAAAAEHVAGKLGRGWTGAAWYACIGLLLAPSLVSHFADGSRHDYRAAAAVVRAQHHGAEPILSDDAETISYYLPDELKAHLRVRTKVPVPPPEAYLLVCRSNAWMAQPQVPHRRVDLLAEISHRRLDQFSHILRVYRVAPADATPDQ